MSKQYERLRTLRSWEARGRRDIALSQHTLPSDERWRSLLQCGGSKKMLLYGGEHSYQRKLLFAVAGEDRLLPILSSACMVRKTIACRQQRGISHHGLKSPASQSWRNRGDRRSGPEDIAAKWSACHVYSRMVIKAEKIAGQWLHGGCGGSIVATRREWMVYQGT